MSGDDLKQAQKIMVYITKKVHAVCVKHNIKYWLDYGSLLGAIRHGGFIPWDDDMDICMLREDYEKFCKIAQEELGEEFFWQTPETEPNFFPEFGRVRLKNTLWLSSYLENANFSQNGFFLDIFPLDPFPKSRFLVKMITLYKGLANCVVAYKIYKSHSPNIFKHLMQIILSCILPICFLKFCSRRIISWLQKYEKKSNMISKICMDTEKDWCDRSFTEEVILKPFEDTEFFIPKKYDERLKHYYGNYMQPPPVEQRYGHHGIRKIDFGPYNAL